MIDKLSLDHENLSSSISKTPSNIDIPSNTESVANASIIQLFPDFQVYTASQLSEMTPEQLVEVLQKLGKLRDTISSELIKLDTQISSIKEQIEQTRSAIRQEFSVDSLADLERLQQDLLTKIEKQYAELAELVSGKST